MKDSHNGKTFACRTKVDDKFISGWISLSQHSISLKLVGYEDYFHLMSGHAIPLEIEDNSFCTVTTFNTSTGTHATGDRDCHYLEASVQQAIIGFRPWRATDLVRKISFKISDTNSLLIAPDIARDIANSTLGRRADCRIIEASHEGITFTVSRGSTYNLYTEKFTPTEAMGSITFDDAKDISKLHVSIGVIKTFLTVFAGKEVAISDFLIEPADQNKQPLQEEGSVPAYFQLFWPSGSTKKETPTQQPSSHNAFRTWGQADRETTSNCLKFWIESWPEWQHAFRGAFTAIKSGRNFDIDRIISACKWLEVTPGTKQVEINDKSKIDQVLIAATQKALELDLNINERLSGAIKNLATESRDSTLIRLINQVIPDKNSLIKDEFRKDLHKAYRIRGNFAHAKFHHSNSVEFTDYVRAIMAVEALALLLLYRSLPIPTDYPMPWASLVNEYLFEIGGAS